MAAFENYKEKTVNAGYQQIHFFVECKIFNVYIPISIIIFSDRFFDNYSVVCQFISLINISK